MTICNTKTFILPEYNLIGGTYKEFSFPVHDADTGTPLNTADLTGKFALISYTDRNGSPVHTINMTVNPDDPTAFLLKLTPADTKNLHGKYIYQISIRASENKQQHFQGIMIIDKNIYPNAF